MALNGPSYRPYSGNYGTINGNLVPEQIGIQAESTSRLLSKVLGMTSVAFALTAAGSYASLGIAPGLAMIIMLLNFATLFAIRAVRANPARQMTLFYTFAFLEGIGLGPTIQHYLGLGGAALIMRAAGTTFVGMAMFGTFAYAVSVNWRKILSIGSFLLIGVLVLMLASFFFHFVQPTTIDWLILAVFSLLTVGDFSRIRSGGGGATASELALSIFLDGLNIFLAVLRIFGNNRD
jgi:modulator of FtsH protease